MRLNVPELSVELIFLSEIFYFGKINICRKTFSFICSFKKQEMLYIVDFFDDLDLICVQNTKKI